MVVQVLGDVPPELHVTPEQDERLAEQAARVGQAEVVRLIELIAAALRAMKDGADARTQLELALVKAATPDLEPSVKALQARIARLGAAGGPGPRAARSPDARAPGDGRRPRRRARRRAAVRRAAPRGRSGRRRAVAGRAVAGRAAVRRAAPAAAPPSAAPPPAAPRPPRRPAVARGRRRRPDRGRTAVTITAQVEGQPPVAVHDDAARRRGRRAGGGAARRRRRGRGRRARSRDRGRSVARGAAVAVVEPDAPAPAPSLGVSVEHSVSTGRPWSTRCASGTPMLAAALDDASPVPERRATG